MNNSQRSRSKTSSSFSSYFSKPSCSSPTSSSSFSSNNACLQDIYRGINSHSRFSSSRCSSRCRQPCLECINSNSGVCRINNGLYIRIYSSFSHQCSLIRIYSSISHLCILIRCNSEVRHKQKRLMTFLSGFKIFRKGSAI